MEGFKLAGHTGVEHHPNHGGSSKGQVLDAQPTETHPFQESADEFTVIDHVPFSMSSDRQGYLGAMIEKATTKITNMYFQVIDESTKMNLAQLLSSEFVMLGRKITNVEEAVKVVQDLVYFSYRKFDYPIVYKGRKLYTDNLWGCTLRAAQMLFAVLYKRVYPTAAHNDIIELFKEYKEPEKGPFSILRICEVGSTSYTGRPGEYWNCLTSMLSLKDLFFAQPGVSSMLSFLCFHNNMISFGEFAKSDFGTDEVMVLGETEADDIDVFHTKKLVYFVGLLGDQRICEENYQCLKLLMDLPTFCGMLGGVGTRAHYVYGYNKDMLLYLDPHMAQDFNSKAAPEYKTYQVNKDKINCIPYKSFNPSMVLTFLISNNKELDKFKDTFKTMSNMSSYFFCDETENMTPAQLEVRMSSSAPSLKFMEEHQDYAGNDEGATPWESEFMTI